MADQRSGAARKRRSGPLLRALCGALLSLAVAGLTFSTHFNLSTAGSLQLLLIVLIALRWGFKQASVASVVAVVCLNYLFTPPVFKFSVAAPENWVALATFEATALLVSALSSKVGEQAEQAEVQRSRIAKLYELSKALLLIEPQRTGSQRTVAEQLAALIQELMQVRAVDCWDVYHEEGTALAREIDLTARDNDDMKAGVSRRVLRLGTTPIGAMVLRGWEVDAMLADAIASLAAVALERARSLEKESRAEAARQTEQLRTAVLDGLAHAFKTPLTAILTASSGLLAIGGLTETQAELTTLIDEEALTLNRLTTRLLQTAALESREIRLRRSTFAVRGLIDDMLAREAVGVRERIRVSVAEGMTEMNGDAQLIRLALAQLIDNAAKYATLGSAIDLMVRREGAEVAVTVGNTGSSIRAEERERIFERFYRGSDAARGPAGTGLGLSIVKKAAEAHHGRAWVECEGDQTCFIFTVMHQSSLR